MGLRTETEYKAVSLDDLAKQREVRVAEYDETVNSEATREEGYHTFFGEVSSASKRGGERHAVENVVTTNGEKSADAVVVKKFRNGNGAKGRTKNQLSRFRDVRYFLKTICRKKIWKKQNVK